MTGFFVFARAKSSGSGRIARCDCDCDCDGILAARRVPFPAAFGPVVGVSGAAGCAVSCWLIRVPQSLGMVVAVFFQSQRLPGSSSSTCVARSLGGYKAGLASAAARRPASY